MGDCRVSLLFQRAFGALEALHAGDGRPESGGLLEWTLALGTWLIERRGGRPPSADVITPGSAPPFPEPPAGLDLAQRVARSEEHTSELQSREKLVCRLLLEKKDYDVY